MIEDLEFMRRRQMEESVILQLVSAITVIYFSEEEKSRVRRQMEEARMAAREEKDAEEVVRTILKNQQIRNSFFSSSSCWPTSGTSNCIKFAGVMELTWKKVRIDFCLRLQQFLRFNFTKLPMYFYLVFKLKKKNMNMMTGNDFIIILC